MSVTRVLMNFEDEGLQRALQAIAGVELQVATDRSSALAALPEAEVTCVASFDREMLARGHKLRWIQAFLGGVERVLFPELVASPIPLTCVKECFAAPGAEHAMATILAVSYRLDYYLRAQRLRSFEFHPPEGIAGKTLGILGFGNIGQALAVRARPFGLRVLATTRRARQSASPADELLTPDQMPRLLRESDFVVVAVPSTAETKNLVATPLLAQMRPTAWLIDMSGRQSVVNYDDVLAALKERRIAGADLQFGQPPTFAATPARDSWIWELDNLIMSQYSANSEQETRDAIALTVDNMRRYREGRPLRGLVDKAAGY